MNSAAHWGNPSNCSIEEQRQASTLAV
ncbi:hypothetical protein YPPY55_1125, partial [Yersinia pestis PY-55]